MHTGIDRQKRAPRLRLTLQCITLSCLLACANVLGDQAPDTGSALFWQVFHKDRLNGYLLGTIHSEDPRVLDFSAALVSAISACDVYAMEIVPDLPTLSRLTDYMHYQDGSTLQARVGPGRYAEVQRALAHYPVPQDWKEKMKIWAVMITLSVPPPQTGFFMDLSLSLRAAGAGLSVTGLETLEGQLAFLENMPQAFQLELLDQALLEFDRVAATHQQMVDAYLSGDLAAVAGLTGQQFERLSPAIREYFIDQGITARNRRMVDKLAGLLQDSCVFTAVGALHLSGAAGVVALLRARGYTLTPSPLPLNGLAELNGPAVEQPR